MSTEIRTYEIVTKSGTFRIDIPEAWKVTFGPVIGAKGYEGGGMVFRVWESEKQQRALFSNVESFRDLSLPMKIKAVRKYGTPDNAWLLDNGTFKDDEVERAWKDESEVVTPPALDMSEDSPYPYPKSVRKSF